MGRSPPCLTHTWPDAPVGLRRTGSAGAGSGQLGPARTAIHGEEAVARWRAAGQSEEVIGFLLQVYGNTPEVGRTVVDTVEKVTGRPARSFARWAAEHADAFKA